MLQFSKNYLYYMQIEVLEPNFHKFKQALASVKTLDEIMTLHSQFLDVCLKEMLLTDQTMRTTITQIQMRTHYFSKVIIRYFASVQGGEENTERDQNASFEESKEDEYFGMNPALKRRMRAKAQAERMKREMEQNNYSVMVNKFDKDFDKHMKDLLTQLTKTKRYETHIANLSQRLDYNGYYSSRLHSDFTVIER